MHVCRHVPLYRKNSIESELCLMFVMFLHCYSPCIFWVRPVPEQPEARYSPEELQQCFQKHGMVCCLAWFVSVSLSRLFPFCGSSFIFFPTYKFLSIHCLTFPWSSHLFYALVFLESLISLALLSVSLQNKTKQQSLPHTPSSSHYHIWLAIYKKH